MEIYFTKLCIIKIMFNQVLNFDVGFAHRLYRIDLLIPAAFDFKMMDIHTFRFRIRIRMSFIGQVCFHI